VTNHSIDTTTTAAVAAITGSLRTAGELATTRRRFLMGAGGVAAVGLLAACGGDDDTASGDTTTTTKPGGTTTAPGGNGAADLQVGAFAASLEVLAVNTYGAALDAATAGKLGDVPPAVAEFVTTAKAHHQAALDAWNDVLTGAGKAAIDSPPADLETTVNAAFGEVTDVIGAARLALMLEQIAAATYLEAIPALETEGAIALASSIQPIDMQHAAVLLFVLGEDPVPDNFAKTELSAVPK
jgi:hypothetical protein